MMGWHRRLGFSWNRKKARDFVARLFKNHLTNKTYGSLQSGIDSNKTRSTENLPKTDSIYNPSSLKGLKNPRLKRLSPSLKSGHSTL